MRPVRSYGPLSAVPRVRVQRVDIMSQMEKVATDWYGNGRRRASRRRLLVGCCVAVMVLAGAGTQVDADVFFDQVGRDIDGVRENDRLRSVVAISDDGDRVAISAAGELRSDSTGSVRIFDWDGVIWSQIGDLELGLGYPGSLAFSGAGDRLAIGTAGGNSPNAVAIGGVAVFDWDGDSWDQAGAAIEGFAEYEFFSRTVELSESGDRLAVGASGARGTGVVRTYDWDGVRWARSGDDIEGEAEGDLAGVALALSADGDRVAIGSP